MNRKKNIAGILGFGLVSLAVWTVPESDRGARETHSRATEEGVANDVGDGAATVEIGRPVPARQAFGISDDVVEIPIFISNDLAQSVSFEFDEPNLRLHTAERGEGSSVPDELHSVGFSTAYRVIEVAPAGRSHAFYVNGTARNGDDVLELWEVSVGTGGRFVTPAAVPQPLGTPSPPYAVAGDVLGGFYASPSTRSGATTVARTELYRGQELGAWRALAADPEGRFVLVVAGAKLFRIDVATELAPPVELPTSFAAMDRVEYVFIRELASISTRTLVLIATPDFASSTLWYLAFDAENDGHFELPGVVLDEAAYSGGDLLEESAWSADFVEFL